MQNRKEIKQRESFDKNKGLSLERVVAFEEKPLPPPEELAKYKEIDSSLVDFLIRTSQKEQDSRIEQRYKQLDIVDNTNRKTFRVNILGLTYAFILVLVAFGLTTLLLLLGKVVWGSIFGSAALISLIAIFMPNRKQNNQN